MVESRIARRAAGWPQGSTPRGDGVADPLARRRAPPRSRLGCARLHRERRRGGRDRAARGRRRQPAAGGDPDDRRARSSTRSTERSRARRRSREVLPGIDGRRLDDIVDYLNYVIVPVVFMVAAGYLHPAVARAADPRQRLRILPAGGQDRGRLLPRLPVLLERRGALRLAARRHVRTHRDARRRRARDRRLRAAQVPLPEQDAGERRP